MLHLSQIHLSITINEGKYILSQYFTLLILYCASLLAPIDVLENRHFNGNGTRKKKVLFRAIQSATSGA